MQPPHAYDTLSAMRRYLFLALLTLLWASTAWGQKKGIQEFAGEAKPDETAEEAKEAKRKASGAADVKVFGAAKEPPPKPFTWGAVGLAVLCMLYRSTRKDLEDQSTFGVGKGRKDVAGAAAGEEAPRIGRRPPARGKKDQPEPDQKVGGETRMIEMAEEPTATPRDAVWDAINAANGSWVTADWVASNAGLPVGQAGEEIGALVSEGYLQEARDRNGKPVFRAA